MKSLFLTLFLAFFYFNLYAQMQPGAEYKSHFNGPLKKSVDNPRYFTDNSGKSIYLTGSHTWVNFQDYGPRNAAPFDNEAYVNFLAEHNHNFNRLWTWEQFQKAPWSEEETYFTPMPWLRSGKKKAIDGEPQFDLNKWNEDYFTRLRQRVIESGNKGIYTSVMLFQGFSLDKGHSKAADPWPFHPLNPKNNVQGIGPKDSTIDYEGKATMHSMKNPEVLRYQEMYVLKVLTTLTDLDNVLYEIINEGGNTDWTYHIIDFIHEQESKMPKQHMVGMTNRIEPTQKNQELMASNADWISPAMEPQDWEYPGSAFLSDYKENPPANNSPKVIIIDTDHIWGHGGNYRWAWKCFTRGLNPAFMDPYKPLFENHKYGSWFHTGKILRDTPDYPDWELLRLNMGYIRRLADRLDLLKMSPHNELSSTKYCLASPGKEYVIYFPEGGTATLDLNNFPGDYEIEWFIPLLNRTLKAEETLKGNDYQVIAPPFTGDAVLFLKNTSK